MIIDLILSAPRFSSSAGSIIIPSIALKREINRKNIPVFSIIMVAKPDAVNKTLYSAG